MRTAGEKDTFGRSYSVRTTISDTDLAAACDPRVILSMVRAELASRICDFLMEGLEPKLRTILDRPINDNQPG